MVKQNISVFFINYHILDITTFKKIQIVICFIVRTKIPFKLSFSLLLYISSFYVKKIRLNFDFNMRI